MKAVTTSHRLHMGIIMIDQVDPVEDKLIIPFARILAMRDHPDENGRFEIITTSGHYLIAPSEAARYRAWLGFE